MHATTHVLPKLSATVSPYPLLSDMAVGQQERIANQIFDSTYADLMIVSLYGESRVRGVLGVSVRFAQSTLPALAVKHDDAILCHATWLSLVWIVDGLVDSGRIGRSATGGILRTLDNVLAGDRAAMATALEDGRADPILHAVGVVYSKYLDLTKPFAGTFSQICIRNAHAWLSTFLAYAQTSTTYSTLAEYARFRLVDGCIMCVIWNHMLFLGIGPAISDALLQRIALLAAYHNDVVSLDRDIANGTNNLVCIIKNRDQCSSFVAAQRAIVEVDKLAESISSELENAGADIRDLLSCLVYGDYNWGVTDQRYCKGTSLVAAVLANDEPQFETLLAGKYLPAIGEPV